MSSVCILTTVHPTSDQRIFRKQARALVDGGFDVSAVAHHDGDERRDGVEIRSLGEVDTRFDRWRHVYDAYRTAARLDADVYHFHDPELLLVGALLARRTDGKVIYDAHEYYPDAIYMREWIPMPIRWPLSRAFPYVESAFARELDAIITADEPTAEAFRRRGHERVVTIRNFPRIESISVEPSVERDHDQLLAYVGQLSPERGLFRMLRLVAQLRETTNEDVGLWLLGEFKNDETERRAHDLIAEHDLEASVRLFGRVEYEAVVSVLAATDVGLALIDTERCRRNVPTKLFEYMLAGLPVVATSGRSIRRYLDESLGAFVPEDDTETQASVVAELLADEARMKRMGKRAAETVRTDYAWEREADRLLDLYEKLLGETRPATGR
ncbi:glycosyltransferase family 4 protein [Halalkalicoccus subterraneus]|uniref:glycosyltransferase family 4 protein n=1 Tax=Halalkalicoccus subterraneus TaxID=2675002 RepID=UPI000EFAC1C9|nr:glycosyltransferase family 4 protein [Halalkalicoccus subterraneus]